MLIGVVPKIPADAEGAAASKAATAPSPAIVRELDRFTVNEHLEVDAGVRGEKRIQRARQRDAAGQLRAVVVAESTAPGQRLIAGEGRVEGDEVRPRAQYR